MDTLYSGDVVSFCPCWNVLLTHEAKPPLLGSHHTVHRYVPNTPTTTPCLDHRYPIPPCSDHTYSFRHTSTAKTCTTEQSHVDVHTFLQRIYLTHKCNITVKHWEHSTPLTPVFVKHTHITMTHACSAPTTYVPSAGW